MHYFVAYTRRSNENGLGKRLSHFSLTFFTFSITVKLENKKEGERLWEM